MKTTKKNEALTIEEVASELSKILQAVGYKLSRRTIELKLTRFAREHGEDMPSRLLTVARIERKYGRSLACVLYDLDGTGKTFKPHCRCKEMATRLNKKEAANA